MKTPQHTPGPWRMEQVPSSLPKNNHWTVVAASPHMSGLRQTVCDINGPHASENYHANARLIAAAPELLQALIACLLRLDSHEDQSAPECLTARAAIAKATES